MASRKQSDIWAGREETTGKNGINPFLFFLFLFSIFT